MKIRILANTNIRIDPRNLAINPIGVVFLGSELKVEDRLYKGANIEGIDTYFKDENGWYYWSGKIAILYKELPAPMTAINVSLETTSEAIGGSWQLPTFEKQEETQRNTNEPDPHEERHDMDQAPIHEAPIEKEKTNQAASFEALIDSNQKSDENETTITPKSNPFQSVNAPSIIDQNHRLVSPLFDAIGIPKFWKMGNTLGKDIKIALLDGQIDRHSSDLSHCLAGEFITDQLVKGKEETTDKFDTASNRRAGLVAGSGHQSMLGVCPEATLYGANIYSHNGQVNYFRLVEALEWAIANQVDIIYTSADMRENALAQEQRKMLHNLSRAAHQKGMLIVAPVGDGKSNHPENRYPGSLPYNVSVGAVDDTKTTTSLRSTGIDIVAPIKGLYSDGYDNSNKSSTEAAAFVTGITALLLAVGRKKIPTLYANTIKDLLRHTAVPKYPGTKCRDLDYGCGIINVSEAMTKLLSS